MKQTEIAQRAGVTQAAISNIITTATRKPSAPTLLRLAAALQANPNWIITGEGKPFEITTVGRDAEKMLLEHFRELDKDSQAALTSMAKALKK